MDSFNIIENHQPGYHDPAKAQEKHTALADRLLRAILDGHRVSRLNCEGFKIPYNYSVHSLASYLKNERNIPLESTWTAEDVCEYSMTPEDIAEYLDPERRAVQAARVLREVAVMRFYRGFSQATKLVKAAAESETIGRFPLVLEDTLKLHQATGAAIRKMRRAMTAPAQKGFVQTHDHRDGRP